MASRDNGHPSESAVKPATNGDGRVKAKKTNAFRWTLGLVVRLCIWYALLTPFFRCPSNLSELNATSPRVCKPYLIARSYIDPHVTPYYETYAAPYVDATRPYVKVINEKVYTPSVNVAKRGYDRYGAPALNQAQSYGQQQWDAQVAPHLQLAKDKANALYTAEVAPHVQRVEAALSPYYQRANAAIRSTCQDYILPFYAKSQPFIGKTYTSGQDVLTTTVLPYAQSTWSSALTFASGSLWPKLTGLYSENVEPQLVKIGHRLASYREGKKLRSVAEEAESSTEQSTSATPASVEAVRTDTSTTTSVVTASPTPQKLSAAEIKAQTRERIASDLETWKEKFAVAADNGIEELESRLAEIIKAYVASEADHYGESLVATLQAVVEQETTSIKERINSLAGSLPTEDSPQEEEKAQESLVSDVRESAMTIRDRAHTLREWRHSFEEELLNRVSTAARSTLAVLDSVRDLGFQEIGMRWAWMEGVTYKDWEKYHSLKAEFEDWRNQFLEDRLKHASLEEARSSADEVLSRGMDAAEAAAKELARLKEVGKWKITAREVSDNFETRTEPPPMPPQPIVIQEEESATGEIVSEDEDLFEEGTSTETSTESDESEVETNTSTENVESQSGEFESGPGDVPVTEDHKQDEAPLNDSDESAEPTGFGRDAIVEPEEQNEDSARNPAWGAEAAAIPSEHESVDGNNVEDVVDVQQEAKQPLSTEDKEENANGESNEASEASDKPSYRGSVEDLVNKLLADKDAAFAEDVKLKLQAIYGTPDLAFEAPVEVKADSPSPSAPSVPVEEVVESVSEEVEAASASASAEAAETAVPGSADETMGNDEQLPARDEV